MIIGVFIACLIYFIILFIKKACYYYIKKKTKIHS
jgi:hypothetical protein